MAIFLGFDTGGTYTDAVIYDEDRGVLASAKALTTKADLSIGLGEALGCLPGDMVAKAALVSVSTTLATNALVEAHAAPAALILIGQGPQALERAGLGRLVGDGPVVYIDGGHTGQGDELAALDENALKTAIMELAPTVDSFAVAGYFSVRNPAHEERARQMIQDLTDKPVTCSHELSSNLDAPRRALTTLINARLIPLLRGLILSLQGLMKARDLQAPLMVVRGDGSLILASSALQRPVETILSGPAASVIGASHLAGVSHGVVSDMGGTTTDVVMFSNGRPTINRDGAMVGGWRTMVEAVNVRTYGLGGDSEVHVSGSNGVAGLLLGPRRVVPLSLLAWESPVILELMKKQLKRPVPAIHDGRFAVLLRDTGMVSSLGSSRSNKVIREVMDLLRQGPVPLHEIASIGRGEKVLQRLLDEGRAVISAFTPSDASHVMGKQKDWNTEAAHMGAELFLRRVFGMGFWHMAQNVEEFCALVFERTVVESVKTVVGSILGEHYGIEPEPGSRLARFLLEGAAEGDGEGGDGTHDTQTETLYPDPLIMEIKLQRPLLPVGAPAETYYGGPQGVARRLGADLVHVPHSDVANAVGAVVGSVKGVAVVLITEPDTGLFRVHCDTGIEDYKNLDKAITSGEITVTELACERARLCGASETDTTLVREDNTVDVGGGKLVFLECRLTATARGRPDLAGELRDGT
jgi:N-methylhydantoinase A/oxoprolinase/acetone carboxylase beta subunit